jgi:hypothetical protein
MVKVARFFPFYRILKAIRAGFFFITHQLTNEMDFQYTDDSVLRYVTNIKTRTHTTQSGFFSLAASPLLSPSFVRKVLWLWKNPYRFAFDFNSIKWPLVWLFDILNDVERFDFFSLHLHRLFFGVASTQQQIDSMLTDLHYDHWLNEIVQNSVHFVFGFQSFLFSTTEHTKLNTKSDSPPKRPLRKRNDKKL